jgi:hypothetical protein
LSADFFLLRFFVDGPFESAAESVEMGGEEAAERVTLLAFFRTGWYL